jgi:hypothetical protein
MGYLQNDSEFAIREKHQDLFLNRPDVPENSRKDLFGFNIIAIEPSL